MSFVTDVLTSSGKLKREQLNTKVTKLIKHVNRVKDEVQDVLQKRYVEFLPSNLKTSDLASKLQEYDSNILELTNIVQVELKEQLESSNSELLTISQQLRETTLALQFVHKLVKIHECLQNSSLQFTTKDFVGAVQNTETLNSLVNGLHKEWGEHVSIIRGLREEVLVRHEKLMYDMIELWNKKIVWRRNDEPEYVKVASNTGTCQKSMTLSVEISEISLQDELSSLMQGLHLFNCLQNRLKMFSDRLLENFIIPITTQQCVIQIAESQSRVSIEVAVTAPQTSAAPLPAEVCKNLEIIVKFLYDNLFNVTIRTDSEAHMMNELGHLLYQKVYDLMVKECISPAVPSQKKDMDKYNLVIESVIKLQDSLVTYKFVSADDQSLLDYAKNVDTLLMNKMCRDILAKSRDLMSKQLHDSVTVEEMQAKNLHLFTASEEQVNTAGDGTAEDYSSSKSFKFPTCQVSNSTNELVKLIRNTVTDAMTCDEKCCIRLLCTVRNIIELYLQTTPVIHKENLQSLPQQTALFYNNCMYLAYCIMTFGYSFKPKHGKILKEAGITFVDLIPQVRSLAADTFLAQMRNQRQMLLDNLNEAGRFQELMLDTRGVELVHVAIKKCILQLQRLNKIWVGILPDNVYLKAAGTLVNTVLEDLVDKLVVLEDLPSDCASQLACIFKMLQEKVPHFLQVSADASSCTEAQIHKRVAKWSRFKLAIFLLDASLLDIDDHWADGKGPLAEEFTADEIKRMIQALFQSSDRRTTLISKIK